MNNTLDKPKAPPRTLGPVVDLERHLPTDWWRTLFNAIYLKTDGDVVENEKATAREVDVLVEATGIESGDAILDLCCGHGRHSIELVRRGFGPVTGVDRSRYLIRLARKRAKQSGVCAAFREGDARRLRLAENSMKCVVLFGNSFGYFEREEDDRAVLEAVLRVLQPSGTVALDIANGEWLREHFEPRSWEWIDQNHFVCRERSLATDGRRLISREVVTHAERGVIADQFYAERLYSWSDIRALLERVGFTGIVNHGPLVGLSDRAQDLGMMAHRIFITARKPVRMMPKRRLGPAFSNVTVILGDPSLPDSVKRDGVYNPEDFETLDKMKEALEQLKTYDFAYLTRHDSLLADLLEEKPDFVLNLCDEGFQNDAFKELHVPALLEILGIPYTGAGPACLGLCYHKAHVRAIAQCLEIPVPLETLYNPEDQTATLPSVFPALMKPNFGDSSIGITKDAVVRTTEEFFGYWEWLRSEFPHSPLLVQEFLSGPEYSVAIIGNPGTGMTALPILEVDYSALPPELPPILGYESKWLPDSPYWT
ncbi:MAG TPA: methyltransferase domain-containing protein, partial [Candidatus Hydrogenedentes bacterium]|nr:methyltransferase domain-containing protein [Candidatus Hydrogenedentota bacterium]